MATAARNVLMLVLIATAWDAAARGDLTDLARVRPGRSRRVSSAAPTPGSNHDNLRAAPGETRVLADLKGPGTIVHIWLTFNEARPNWISQEGSANPSEVVLRMYWDDAEQPAVESPLGDFFAAGFGLRREVKSAPVQVQGGDAYNCFWPMPFFKRAKVTITNESEKYLNSFYYHIDYVEEESLPPETAYFCAQYRQEFPEELGHDYLILDAVGRGHYVGTVLSMRSRSPEWFGEGDDKFTIDGDEKPALWGTGTEDYFLCAWGMEECAFPYFGCPYIDGDMAALGAQCSVYRWHIADPVRFTKSLRVEIEHKGWMSADETESGKVEGHVEREDDLATVAFWYQQGQPKRFTTLPPAKERILPNLDVIVEGKTLLESAQHSAGEIELQKGCDWTADGQIFFKPADSSARSSLLEDKSLVQRAMVLERQKLAGTVGWHCAFGDHLAQWPDFMAGAFRGPPYPSLPHAALAVAALLGSAESSDTRAPAAETPFLELNFTAQSDKPRGLILRLTHSYDYGRWQVSLDGAKIGGPLDLYAKEIEVHDHLLANVIKPGQHTLRLESVGRNLLSTGDFLGVDSVRLRERWDKKRPALKP